MTSASAVKVNSGMLLFYWDLGADIVARQTHSKWGEGFLAQLSKDFMADFPDTKGLSLSNLKYIKQWYLFNSGEKLTGRQPVGQFTKQAVSRLTQSTIE
ncbi:MAG: hypothetical protein A2Z81_06420 [Omnitrophica WOR_2 bacterium GWA2_45_18]|nr:MAG: hypothetical protein A2Z81_06420 [Omnitrophica WOR_2 bacterium GWA2_45_18]